MKYLFFTATLCLALLLTAACSTSTNTNTNTNTGPAGAPASTPATAAASPASQSAAQDFTLVNKTGVEIHAVYIAPHDVDDWQEDILGRDTLPDGETVDIKFNRKETAENWDLRIEDSKGNAIEWENLNLLKISKATLFYENGKARAEVE
ncbi:MAG: hypothetical protein ACT4OT_05420 [Acidobacteriota bacterium]